MESGCILVIVPVYNSEKFLWQWVESILCQAYRDIEVVLIDDGSKDGSPALCDAFASADSRVKVIHKENGGASSARNAGLALLREKHKFVSFIDSDDYIEPDMYEK